MSFLLVLFSVLKADPISPYTALNDLKSNNLNIIEIGKLHGYYSTESCVYQNTKIVFIKNYCRPVKNYPAKSYMFFSNELGFFELYQEETGFGLQKRIRQRVFPEDLKSKFNVDPLAAKISDINAIMNYYSKNIPRFCYVTSEDNLGGDAQPKCYLDQIEKYLGWAEAVNPLIEDDILWNQLIQEIEKNIPVL